MRLAGAAWAVYNQGIVFSELTPDDSVNDVCLLDTDQARRASVPLGAETRRLRHEGHRDGIIVFPHGSAGNFYSFREETVISLVRDPHLRDFYSDSGMVSLSNREAQSE